MKKSISTFLGLFLFITAFSQTSYYWVGGANGAWTDAASWSATLNGTPVGTTGTLFSNKSNDVYIFDGSNVGSGVTITPVIAASTSFAQLKLQNGAKVAFLRSASGGSTYSIMGDGTSANDLTIDATSSLKITASVSAQGFTLAMGKTIENTSGLIAGSIITDDGTFAAQTNARLIDSSTAGSLLFAAGSYFYFNNHLTGSTHSQAFTGSTAYAIKFQAGSNFVYQGTSRLYTSTEFPLQFDKGSNFILEASPVSSVSSRVFSNVIVRNNQTISLDGTPYLIDTLVINSGSALYIRSTGNTNLAGDLINNGTFGSAGAGGTSSALLMCGSVPQTIGGSGTYNAIGALQIGAGANVTLSANITLNGTSTSSVVGKLNAQNYTISTTGASSFSLRAATAPLTTGCKSSTTTTDGYNITLPTSVYASGVNTANAVAGALVTGSNIQPNTYVIATSSGASTITISKPLIDKALASFDITLTNPGATLTTSNVGGVDGTLSTSLLRGFGTGTNYVFNAATTTPFGTGTNNAAGSVTFNAPATTNQSQRILGVLNLNGASLTIRPIDTVRLGGSATIVGASASNYIVLQNQNSPAAVGVLRKDSMSAPFTLPVGTLANYLPVTLTPTGLDSVNVSVYEGVTADATITGTPLPTANIVNATWVLNRVATGVTQNIGIALNYTNPLKGAGFSALSSSQIGISNYVPSAWSAATATSANSATNNVSASYTTLGSFYVGQINAALPVQIQNLTASLKNSTSTISWQAISEISIAKYEIEKSNDGSNFTVIGFVNAINNTSAISNYRFVDVAINSGNNYYRIKIISQNGEIKYTSVLIVKSSSELKVSIYPNPATSLLNISGLQNAKFIQVYNAAGRIVIDKKIDASITALSVDVALLQAGIYTLKVTGNGIDDTKAFIKR